MANTPRAEKDYVINARNLAKPTTDILERIRDVAKTKGIIRKILISPAMAWDILILNVNNRPVKQATVLDFSRDMEEEKWQYTNESIIAIDTNIHLLDSQHRLLAILKSAKGQFFDIITGYDPETFKVLNKGRNRTPGDSFALEGIKDHNKSAAAAAFIIGLTAMGRVLSGSKAKGLTDTMMIEWVRDEKNKKRLTECVTTADALYKAGRWIQPSVYAGMLFILGNVRKADAEEFLTRLATGEDISTTKNSPVYFLRRRLEQWEKYKDWGKAKDNEMKVRFIITAWNHYVQKDGRGNPLQITALKLDKDEEGIPKIRRS